MNTKEQVEFLLNGENYEAVDSCRERLKMVSADIYEIIPWQISDRFSEIGIKYYEINTPTEENWAHIGCESEIEIIVHMFIHKNYIYHLITYYVEGYTETFMFEVTRIKMDAIREKGE